MDLNQYLGMFLEESREHLQSLNRCLLELENDPGDLSVLDEIFRSAHTIKGMSATMGYSDIAELTHEMENILDLLRKATVSANHDIINTLFQCVDTLERLVESVSTNETAGVDIKPLIIQLIALAKGEKTPTNTAPVEQQTTSNSNFTEKNLNSTEVHVIQGAISEGLRAFEVQILLRDGCLLKSARAYMVMSALDELGDVIKSIPSADDLEKENFDRSFQIILVTSSEPEKIEESILSISEIESVKVLLCVLEGNVAPIQLPSLDVNQIELSSQGDEQHVATPSAQQTSTGNEKRLKSGQSVRVDIDKLDSLLNLVGELVINKTRLEQIGITHKLGDLAETIEQIDRVTTDLQAVVMKVRMVPVGQVFNRFPRMIRDLSHELHKEINLIIQGEETELDRTVIDEIGDPLVHLLRNAVDHGIEHDTERQATSKNPVGEIRLIARHEGNNVIIMVEDDGKGIDVNVIRSKALRDGFITQVEADSMDNTETLRLLFLPGFSTAQAVTDVSGRGVGMDAVKTKIEALGGTVEIDTKVGVGSKFKIRLPLTLAIIQALLIRVSQEIYAIPLGSIDSTINIQAGDIKTIQNREVILLRGQIIPIVRLAKMLNTADTENRELKELFVVIVHMGEQRAGIIVDDLIGQQEIVIKSLGNLLRGIKVIAGATILGNGQVALILDVGTLMK
jgi:two-component system, chemotaxis family, sensor kinase CheA